MKNEKIKEENIKKNKKGKKGKRVLLAIAIIFAVCLITSFISWDYFTKKIKNVENYMSEVNKISVKDNIKIVGLGEATHGNSELQTLKLDVFKALVENNNCRLFAIEGDFGGCAKVNEYILGGDGTAEEALREIKFQIYNTTEMVDLIKWMREYNDNAPANDKLKFYGYDMQRYDNNKEFLFAYLTKVNPAITAEYTPLLADLNDDTVFTQETAKTAAGLENVKKLIQVMTDSKADFVAKTSEKEYEFAKQCANTISENATVRSGSVQYSNARDEYMSKKVEWIYNYEGSKLLFITGHNGHIEKSSASPVYTSMGDRLADVYKDTYYAIGTDFLKSTFVAQTTDGTYENMKVKNINPLTAQFRDAKNNITFMDFAKAEENKDMKKLLGKLMSMTNINAQFNSWQKSSSIFYTLSMIPTEAYDGIIVLKNANPSTQLK